jgi:hypothetical protein
VFEQLLMDGRMILLALMLLAVEGLLLAFRHRRAPARLLPWLAGLGSGGALLFALHAALTGADWRAIGIWLLLALVAHALDLWFRLRFEAR